MLHLTAAECALAITLALTFHPYWQKSTRST
eukprot:CAMPEP_0183343060 /NCGR_PEP_ID=MMETSP0164_2-20130417/9050_1 /TAXON_ID=221442 /ORGANISM="Coccolithus pelagicus ssp braarudi, Strain PLY182g" /LENGTH=30 /DNA_ID= /DNA_START= /DNA_END= /DNA_ORIENTATION=